MGDVITPRDWASEARPSLTSLIETMVYTYVYGKAQRGQCVSTSGGYFKTLTLVQAQEFWKKHLKIHEKIIKTAKSYVDRIGEMSVVRSCKLSRVHFLFD